MCVGMDVPLHSARFYVSKLLSVHFWLPIATALIYYTNEFKAPIDQFPITIQNSTLLLPTFPKHLIKLVFFIVFSVKFELGSFISILLKLTTQ